MDNPYLLIIAISLAGGLLAGFVMHRSDFCVTAMFRDIFLLHDFFLIRILLLLIVVSMVLFEAGHLSGILTPYPFPLLGVGSVTTLLAGALFGIGMVLAGGCVVGTLYKLGAGSMLSGLAFIGLLTGSALYAEFHPWWSSLARATVIMPAITLPQLMGVTPSLVILPVAFAGALLIYRWWRKGLLQRPSYTHSHIAPWHAALVLSAIGFFSYFFIGMPLGITTSYAKLGATIESLFAPQHVASLGYFQNMGLHYVPPFATREIRGGAGPQLDAVAAIQYPLIVGIVLGAFISALRIGEFRIYYRLPVRQYTSALVGGILLGLAARMVPGCNIWHLWGGLPILAVQSLLFTAGLFPGTWLGSRLLVRYVIR